jgi:hypothetical protein
VQLADTPTFLSFEQIRDELAHWTYRPGWTMVAFNDPYEGPCFYLVTRVPDAYDSTKLTDLRIRSVVPPIPSVEYFGHWLLARLMQIESHECREYLHRDGRPFVDPHDPIEPSGAELASLSTEEKR